MWLGSSRGTSGPSKESAISVYRRHAARAMTEERWPAAEIFLDRIIEVDPRNTEAWLMKGLLRHHCKGDDETAVQCLRNVIVFAAHDSDHPHVQSARRTLGRILVAW